MTTYHQYQKPRPSHSIWFLILAAILMALASSCGAKRSRLEKVSISDSTQTKEAQVKTPPIFYNMTIVNPCDSLGVVKEFDQVSVIGEDTTRLRSIPEENKIVTIIKKPEQVVSEKKEEKKVRVEEKIVKVEVVRWKFHWWYWPLIGILGFGNLYFSGVLKFVKKLPFF